MNLISETFLLWKSFIKIIYVVWYHRLDIWLNIQIILNYKNIFLYLYLFIYSYFIELKISIEENNKRK